jgi:DNA processing protein
MTACDACLRRTALVAAVAARLDVEWRRRSAPAGVLALPDAALLGLDPTGRAERGYAGFEAAEARTRAERAGLALICRCDAVYPESLLELADAPAVLHVAGRA